MQEDNDDREHYVHTARGFLAGILFGGLAGAGVMLLLAPQSGLRTQVQIRRKGIDLRDQAVGGMEDALDQARATSQDLTAKVHAQADKLQLEAEKMQMRGQHALDMQRERWAPVVEAGKKAVNDA